MSKLFTLSEASSIAIHGMILVARSKESVSVNYIAGVTNSSRHHVAKVFQRLVKDNYVTSNRGPTGGFILKKKPEEVTFLDIYETIEGEITNSECPMSKTICSFDLCIFENKIKELTLIFKNYLKDKRLSDFVVKEITT